MMEFANFEASHEALINASIIPTEIEWAGGTLFLTCTEPEARKMYHLFTMMHGIGHVIVNRLLGTDEYAFDFV
jgi:hypothetical protein